MRLERHGTCLIARMSQRHPPREGTAFTLIELLVTLGIIGILAAMLLPAVSKAKARARQAACANHLRQQGIAFHGFAHDHGGLFPQGVSTNNGGALELTGRPEPWFGQVILSPAPFAAISNELGNPRVLVCPAVTSARVATNFATLKVENLGYAVHASASLGDTLGVLALDRNVDLSRSRRVTNGSAPGVVSVVWTPERHGGRGNTLWGDAHVELWRNVDLVATAVTPGVPATSGGGRTGPTSGSGGSPSGSRGGSAPAGSSGPPPSAGGSRSQSPSIGNSGQGTTLSASLPPGTPAGVHPDVATLRSAPTGTAPTGSWMGGDFAAEREAREQRDRILQRSLLWLILLCMILGLGAVLSHAWQRYRAFS